MLRITFIVTCCCVAFASHAQDLTPPKVTYTVPPPAADSNAIPVDLMDWSITGDFTTAPAHPACKDLAGQARKKCTAEHVLQEIKSRLNSAPPTMSANTANNKVQVQFAVDAYGKVEDIVVEYGGDERLAQAVVLALYGLPRFVPAAREGTGVASQCAFSYSPALLFGTR